MNGLEAVELKLSNIYIENDSKRIDAEYFRKYFLNINKLLGKKLFFRNRNVSIIRSGTTPLDRDDHLTNGVILLKTNNIRNNILLNNNDYYYINHNINNKMKSTQLIANDVLINIVGATTDVIGRVAYVSNSLSPANITQAMALCRIKSNKIYSKYLFIFLQTLYGQEQIKRLCRPTGQYNLNLDEVGNIKIVYLKETFQQQIESIVKLAHQKIEQSRQEYEEAENMLLEELGLTNFKPNNESVSIRKLSDSFSVSGRLDSEYYQPKYDSFNNVLHNRNLGYSFIKQEYTHINDLIKKDKLGYRYIEISNINVSDGSYSSNYVHVKDLPANAKILVKKGDVIVSNVRPYRGAIAIIDQDNDVVVSGAFTVLREKKDSKFSSQLLKLLLRTKIYKDWLLKFNVGTSYPVIKDHDVLNLLIPIISDSIQDKIITKINLTHELKKKSEELLNIAKRAVEVAIEKDEQTAIQLIDGAANV